MAKRKPRTPYGYRNERLDGSVLERRLAMPKTWEHRDRLIAFDQRHGMGGRWVRAIDEHFDTKWLHQQVDGKHAVMRAMCWPYALAAWTLAEVADLVLAVEAGGPDHTSVLKRLRVHEEYESAVWEARVARMLHRAGLPFALASSKGASAADIRVDSDPSFVVEVKHIKNAFRLRLPQSLSDALSGLLPGRVPCGSLVTFDWSGPLVAAIREQDEKEFWDVANRAAAVFVDTMRATTPGTSAEMTVPGIGWIRVSPNAARDSDAISMATTADASQRNERRLVKCIHVASDQIGSAMPGVVVLCAPASHVDVATVGQLTRELWQSLGAASASVSGAILLVSAGIGTPWLHEDSWPLPNPYASKPLEELPFDEARAFRSWARFEKLGDSFSLDPEP